MSAVPDLDHTDDRGNAWAVFLIFLRLGLTSFGGLRKSGRENSSTR